MRDKTPMETSITFRISQAEKDEHERQRIRLGLTYLSDFYRYAANRCISNEMGNHMRPLIAPDKIIETNVHLDRIASMLRILVTKASNDNAEAKDRLETGLQAAFKDIQTIRKNVS